MIAPFSPSAARESLRWYLFDFIRRGVRRSEQAGIRAALRLADEAAADPCRSPETWRAWCDAVLGHDPLEAP